MKKESDKYYLNIANEINKRLDLNIFKNTRVRKYIDARSLYCYILKKDYNLTLHQIKELYNSNGKNYDHATVMHSVNNYELLKLGNTHLHQIRLSILNNFDEKLMIIEMIREIENLDRIKEIKEYINLTK